MTAAEKQKAKKARQKARKRAEQLAAADGGGGAAVPMTPREPAPAAAVDLSVPAAVVPCGVPSPRLYFSLVAAPAGAEEAGADTLLVVFGGELQTGKGRSERMQFFKDTFVFSVANKAWAKVDTSSCSPGARSAHHASVVGAAGARVMYMFGGEVGNAKGTSFTHLNDTWAFDSNLRRWQEIKATGDVPSARSGHRTVGLANSLLLFGGFDDTGRSTK